MNKEYSTYGYIFTPKKIKDILKNKRYIGTMIWGEKQDKRKRGWSNNNNIVEVKNSHEGFIKN